MGNVINFETQEKTIGSLIGGVFTWIDDSFKKSFCTTQNLLVFQYPQALGLVSGYWRVSCKQDQ